MIDWTQVAQWLNNNKGNISTAVDVGKQIHNELRGDEYIKEQEAATSAEARKEAERKARMEYRSQQEDKIRIKVLPLVLKASGKSNANPKTLICNASIDYNRLSKLLKNIGINMGVIRLRIILPLCNLNDLAGMIAIYDCDQRKIRPLSSEF